MKIIYKVLSRLAAQLAIVNSARRKAAIKMVNANVVFGQNVRIDDGVSIRTFDGGSITIGSNTHIRANAILEAKEGVIKIGEGSLINAGVNIVAVESIEIGRDALIAEYVTIRDQDHASRLEAVSYSQQGRVCSPIVIGDNVWLAAKVTVTKGLTIPSGVIVGANSVVTRSLTDGHKFAGAPARPLKKKPN